MMEYNECKICGVNNGRAGNLFGNPIEGFVDACKNCHDTRGTGNLVIHGNLQRTDKELKKTSEILSNMTHIENDYGKEG